ncbi:MAG TPA: bifunctional DNA-formamidopyrimidine glycosylase/DNA-(apurinic or apyrimidinic site) lyase [Caulobacteraceae bacterium]
MPELPEVETVRRGLEPVLAGARLARVEARRPDLRFPLPDGFVQRLTGARIERLERRAKYLLAPLDRDETLVMHLGMSGRFEIAAGTPDAAARVRPGDFALAQPPDPKHAHIVFTTEAGAVVTFYDPRRFGYMDLIATETLGQHPWFAGLGPEPVGCGFDAAYLVKAAAGRAAPIKNLLLDQRVIAGLGNIYVCEALHRAGIAPQRAAGTLPPRKLKALAAAIRDVLAEAIEAGGSTLRDYAAADGSLGYFQHRFRVYGREGEPCLRAGCRGRIERIVQAGRSSFACSKCQT